MFRSRCARREAVSSNATEVTNPPRLRVMSRFEARLWSHQAHEAIHRRTGSGASAIHSPFSAFFNACAVKSVRTYTELLAEHRSARDFFRRTRMPTDETRTPYQHPAQPPSRSLRAPSQSPRPRPRLRLHPLTVTLPPRPPLPFAVALPECLGPLTSAWKIIFVRANGLVGFSMWEVGGPERRPA